MINLFLQIFYIFFLLYKLVNTEKINGSITHPIIIRIEQINLDLKNSTHKIMLKYLNNAVQILSKMVNCVNSKKITISSEIIKSKCKRKLKISKKNIGIIDFDLIIFPFFSKFKNGNFKIIICEQNSIPKNQPNIVLFQINSNLNINLLTNTPNKEYLFNLEIFKYLFDCLGLNAIYMLKANQIKNNFFETPKYLLENSSSFKSIKKLYKLINTQLPKTEVNEDGFFYLPYWPENHIIKDFRNEKIDIKNDMTETSINLLNDMDYYTLSKCRMFLDEYGKCHQVDQKCITTAEFNDKYYLKYGINDSKIVCYLSDKDNILNNQCGNKYGPLLNEEIDISPLIIKYKRILKKLKEFEIPELEYVKEQELSLMVPSEKCNSKMPRTVFFKRDYRSNLLYLNDIILGENMKKFFVSYQTHEEIYLNYEFILLAKFNGIIRSYLPLGNHNLILDYMTEKVLKEKGKNHNINKYQKIFNYVGNEIFEKKDLLYKIFKSQQNLFKNEFNFMQLTFIYPEDKKIIDKIFKNYKAKKDNLWMIKQKKNNSGKDAYIFHSLENLPKEFIISKYIDNPHLIDGKKYDIRIFVLVSGIRPLRIYLNKEGFLHIAKENFTLENDYLDNKNIHLTNYLNNNNKITNLIFSKEVKNFQDLMDFKEYQTYLKKENITFLDIRKKIIDVVIKTIISGNEYLLSKLDKYNLNDRSFFNLYGFDFIIDNNYEPHLLKIKGRPDLNIYGDIDKVIKENLFVDTLNIVGIVPFSHDEEGEPLDNVYNNDDPIEESAEFAFCELTRPRGGFELIFPKISNIEKYKKYFRKKTIENESFWYKIKKEESFK